MKTNTEKQDKLFNDLNKEYKRRGRKYVYNIIHQMNIVPKNTYVETNFTPLVMDGIMAYIQHVAWDTTHECCYSLGEDEVLEIINKFYTEVKFLDEPYKSYYEIDLYENWEANAAFDYENSMTEFQREGLLEYIKAMSIRNNWKQQVS